MFQALFDLIFRPLHLVIVIVVFVGLLMAMGSI